MLEILFILVYSSLEQQVTRIPKEERPFLGGEFRQDRLQDEQPGCCFIIAGLMAEFY